MNTTETKGLEKRFIQLEADSKHFATKSDVARLEAELKANMATKDDIRRLEQKIDNAQAQTTKEIYKEIYKAQAETKKNMDKLKIWFLSTVGAIVVANITIIGVMFAFFMQNNT